MDSCIICGSKKNSVVRDTLRYGIKRNVLRCARCSLVYLQPIRNPQYYSGKEYRRKHGPRLGTASSMQEIFNAYFPFQGPMVKAITQLITSKTAVLDVGCSTGHFLAALKGKVKKRVGLELGRDAAAFIRKRLDFKVYTESIERARINEGPFDLITSFQVLEHIEDPLSFLRGIARNLKHDGSLYLELPNLSDALLSVFDVRGYEDFYYREPHAFYYTKDTLARLLRLSGFAGRIRTVQRYSFYNNMHWVMTGRPQDTFSMGNTLPEAKGKGISISARRELNSFLRNTNERYKRLLGMRGWGDTLTFLGRKRL